MTSVRQLADRDPGGWRAATSHPFLEGVRSGALPHAAFDRWLEQDRLFVEALVRAWGLVLAGAPAADFLLLAEGITSFAAELAWFDDVAEARGLAVPTTALPATVEYRSHLLRMAGDSHPVALTVMWVVEAAYLQAWQTALPGAPRYRPFVQHWTAGGFVEFVSASRRRPIER